MIGPFTIFSQQQPGCSRGSFGQIVRGKHVSTGAAVAIKLERKDAVTAGLLKHECKILHYLTKDRGCENVPRVEWWSTIDLDGIAYRALVIPLYDMTLAEAIQHDGTVIHHWVREMIRILYQVHEAGILHRDIKPQNFMLRSSSKGSFIYLIDFGLSSVYVDDAFRGHLPPKPDQEHILGTPKYVSLHVHDGKDASRRDDLISVGYVWLFLLLGGRLPWDQVVHPPSSDTYPAHHIQHPANVERRRQKQNLSGEFAVFKRNPLTTTNPHPHSGVCGYLETVYRLGYDERPPYAELIDMVVV